jgi:PleD family two-component response regulator
MKKVLAVMSDLFFSAKINDAAKKLGMTAVFVKDNAVALDQLKLNPALVIFDLNCTSADPFELIKAMKENPATASIGTVGFISHVQTDMKRKAQDIGCDTVVARSVFAQNLPAILEHFVSQQVREAE